MSVLSNVVYNADEPISVVAFLSETAEMLVADQGHASFQDILDYFEDNGDPDDRDPDEVRDLFDVSIAISAKFERLGERVTIKGNNLFLDGDVLDDVLADTIVMFYREGNEDFVPLVNFLEKVAANPDGVSRESLCAWMRNKSFVLLPNGNFLGYKGVRRADGDDEGLVSIHSGTATVNGEQITGNIPNNPGDVVEMPRSAVDDNRGQGCSTGLHVGTWGYASSFGYVTLTVEVNPRDVVSVPHDCAEQKMRVCRYTVVEQVTQEHPSIFLPSEDVESSTTVADDDVDLDDDEYDYDDYEDDYDDLDLYPDDEDEDEDEDEEDADEAAFNERVAYLLSRDRDTVRRIAREAGVVRGDKNKAELAEAIAEAEFA